MHQLGNPDLVQLFPVTAQMVGKTSTSLWSQDSPRQPDPRNLAIGATLRHAVDKLTWSSAPSVGARRAFRCEKGSDR